MKRIIPIALVILLLLCSVFGCSSSTPRESSASKNASYEGAYYEQPMEPATEDAAYGFRDESAPAPNPSAALSNRKIIRNADVSVETLEFDAFLAQLADSVGAIGGYVESSSVGGRTLRNDQKLRYAHYVVRVPAERLDEFLNTVSSLGNVTSANTGLRDVTTSYVDSEKHLEALRTEQDALLEILSKATTVEDIITVQDRLTHVRYQIESYESTLRSYDDQIALSAVSLNINEVERETQIKEETFGEEVSRRFHESLQDVGSGFKSFGAWLFGNAPEIIVVLVIIGLHVLVVILIVKGAKKRAIKRRQNALAKKAAAAAPKPAEPQK